MAPGSPNNRPCHAPATFFTGPVTPGPFSPTPFFRMVLARTNDACVEAYSPATDLRFLYADVTETTRRLSAGHGLSQPASLVLGKALAGIALLGIDLNDAEETLCVSAAVQGRVGGFHVELDNNGHLRGYLHEKAPETLPASPATPPDDFCGRNAAVKISRLRPDGTVRSQISFATEPGNPETIFQDFLSTASPARLCMAASVFENSIERLCALAVIRMPRCSKATFSHAARLFEDGTIGELISFDATLVSLRDVLGLDDLMTGPTRALAFGCTCSRESVLHAYASEPEKVLTSWISANRPQEFRCHLCGRAYHLSVEDLAGLLLEKDHA